MSLAEIATLIETAQGRGVSFTLGPDDKIRLQGPKIAVREVATDIRRDRAAAVEFLKARPAIASPPLSESANDAVEVGVEDDAPQDQSRFTHCPKCGEPLFAPTPHLQVENFEKWQHLQIQYYWWTKPQLARLESALAADPGSVLMLPAFAHSVNIRRPSGSVYTFFRVK